MQTYTLTAVDTTGIQKYIFGSNRLQENIGASELVRRATGQWALEAVKAVAGLHNIKDAEREEIHDDRPIEKQTGDNAAEVIYAGGGNVVVLFRQAQAARAFAKHLTGRVLREAPGLSVVVAHRDNFDWVQDILAEAVQDLLGRELAQRKAARLPSTPLLGLGVTAVCQSTGLPASRTNEGLKLGNNETTRLIAPEITAKLEARNDGNERLQGLFKESLRGFFAFPADIDALGRVKGEESYVAVVHADGNRMGERIRRIKNDHLAPADNRAYINTLRTFSRLVDKAAGKALERVVGLIARSLTFDQAQDCWLAAGTVPLNKTEDKKATYLPFRPLVFGGDDVTFLCNGPFGISLAVKYLEYFAKEAAACVEQCPYVQGLEASAGIAMVKSHYPFARAYALSEELAKEAKRWSHEKDPGNNPAALDWHFATGGLSGGLKAIRKREYLREKGLHLELRPLLLRVDDHDPEERVWRDRAESALQTFQFSDDWREKRNKVKGLREALRGGAEAVRLFMRVNKIAALPRLVPTDTRYQQTGWEHGRCGYFDAIELLDHFVSFEEWEAET